MKIIKHVNMRRIKRREFSGSFGPAQDQAGSQTGREDGICPDGRDQYSQSNMPTTGDRSRAVIMPVNRS
jgi:hypothetical protein